MKKNLSLALITFCIVALLGSMVSAASLDIVGKSDDKLSTGRSIEDYKAELKKLSGADEVGDIIVPEENEVRYLFVPLEKDGEIIGYGAWVNTMIYNHPEDIIAVVNKVKNTKSKEELVVLKKWKPIDANDHHVELKKDEFLSQYYGMTLKTKFDPQVDVISGSTYSSNTFFFELRNILVTFKKFVEVE